LTLRIEPGGPERVLFHSNRISLYYGNRFYSIVWHAPLGRVPYHGKELTGQFQFHRQEYLLHHLFHVNEFHHHHWQYRIDGTHVET
jgi:hypothetical protein